MHAEQEQGEEEGFGVLLRSAAAFGERVLLAEALHPSVDVLDGQGSECRLEWASPFHRIFYTRCPPIFRTPSKPLRLFEKKIRQAFGERASQRAGVDTQICPKTRQEPLPPTHHSPLSTAGIPDSLTKTPPSKEVRTRRWSNQRSERPPALPSHFEARVAQK